MDTFCQTRAMSDVRVPKHESFEYHTFFPFRRPGGRALPQDLSSLFSVPGPGHRDTRAAPPRDRARVRIQELNTEYRAASPRANPPHDMPRAERGHLSNLSD